MRLFKKNRCPHEVIYSLHGAVAEACKPFKLFCPRCKTFLEGDTGVGTMPFPYPYMDGTEYDIWKTHLMPHKM